MTAPSATVPRDLAETIVDPKAYADGRCIDEAFARIRCEAPLAVAQPDGFDPFWVVSRHDDIQTIERQNELFLAGTGPVVVQSIEAKKSSLARPGGQPVVRTLVEMDNPDHFAFRKLTQGWFMPQNLRALEARIRELARRSVDKMASMGGRCDFARDIALYYPLRVIMMILGVPEIDEPRMLRLTQEMFGGSDPDMNRSGSANLTAEQAAEALQKTMLDFMHYFNDITEDRRKHPTSDLSTAIANGQINGEPIGHAEAIGYYVITATAGHDTTSNTVASGLWALAENPDQFAKLRADPSLIPGHVEESIRWASSVKHFMRSAAEDAEVAGTKIAKGDWLMLCYSSGNRDETVFDDPFRYDVARSPNKHIAFGYGSHVCLGQHLARMEMRIFWEELLPRLESIELDGTPTRTDANFVCGPKSVPVRYRMS
jgi:cytochrome P450